MERSTGRVNPRLIQPGSVVHTRVVPPVETPDVEQMPATFITESLALLSEQMGNIARVVENTAHVVDEYQSQTLVVANESTLEVLPQFELWAERITAVVIGGPAGACTLQLGDRVIPIIIPASLIVVIAPVGILLNRSDRRVLSAATPGDYFLELMGFADERY